MSLSKFSQIEHPVLALVPVQLEGSAVSWSGLLGWALVSAGPDKARQEAGHECILDILGVGWSGAGFWPVLSWRLHTQFAYTVCQRQA